MKIPKVTSILLVVLTSLTFLNFILKYYTYFVLIVSSSKEHHNEVNSIAQETGDIPHPHELYVPLLTFIPTKSPVITRPWVFITNSFIEETITGLVINFFLLFYLGKFLENMWGSKEYIKFIAIIVLISNLSLYFYYVIKGEMFKGQDLPVPPVVMSSMAINMGLFVAIKQRISNHYLLFFKSNLRIKITYLPFLMFGLFLALRFLDDDFDISLQLSVLGFIISWTYLRFFKIGNNERQSYLLPFSLNRKRSNNSKFKKKPGNKNATNNMTSNNSSTMSNSQTNNALQIDNSTIKGDRSEQFSLYTFFPYPISIIIKHCSQSVFNVLIRYKILNLKDFQNFDDNEEIVEGQVIDEVNNLQSNLFGLSSLKGAQGEISTIPNASLDFKKIWGWVSSSNKKALNLGIKNSMDKRRKLALKEFE